tara:strand:+ start:2986 stop:4113 length:1128 start_codon:yes stop_codon:yes gene_type:complete
MHKNCLNKGFEVELFTGTNNSHVGVSSQIENVFSNFVKEPDNRNVEYITDPSRSYKILYESLLQPRKDLRKWLKDKNLTIIPSSTLCFPHQNIFQRSDKTNTYHNFIESNYGLSIATSSVHINLGIQNLDNLFAAIRLVRCEAPLLLALSASSPFLNGKFTGNHSQRWLQFPKTPSDIPFFVDHSDYIKWIEQNIDNGKMQNIRHFWSSVRPNGPKRPHNVDRLELRICDFISSIDLLLAITALLELRVISLFDDLQNLDPLLSSKFSAEELKEISDQNEKNVSKDSLNAELIHWKDGEKILCKKWIENLLVELSQTSKTLKISNYLKPIYDVLAKGNESMQWIDKYKQGLSVEEIMESAIKNMIQNEEKDNLWL